MFEVNSNLWLNGSFIQPGGGFIKTGPGTLHIAGSGDNYIAYGENIFAINDAINKNRLNIQPNGDAPTLGTAGFMIANGTVVLGEGGGNTYVNQNYDTQIGAWTTSDGLETAGTLEIRGGVNRFQSWFNIGKQNGTAATAPTPVQSALRIYGGTTTLSRALDMGRNKMGQGTYPQRCAPRFEMHGGTLNIIGQFKIGNDIGANSTVLHDGGTIYCGEISFGNMSGKTTNLLEICGSAYLQGWNMFNANSSVSTNTVHDGGVLALNTVVNNSGTLVLVFDGGCFRTRLTTGTAVNALAASLSSVQIGAKGMTVILDGTNAVANFAEALTSSPDLGLTPDGGLTVSNLYASTSATLGLNAANTYTGPTKISSGKVAVGLNGTLPAASDLTLASGASLAITNTSQTVASLTLGTEGGDATSVALGVVKGVTLISSGVFTNLNDSPLSVSLFESAGSSAPLTTSGTYIVLTVPLAYADALNALRVTLANPASGTVCTFSKTAGASTASLVATVAAAATVGDVWTNPAGGDWATGSNWQGGTPVDAAGATATFSTESQEGGATVSLASGVTLGGLSFSAVNGYTLTGSPLAFNNGSASANISVAFGSNTLASAASFAGPAVFSTTNGSSLTVSGALTGQDEIAANPAASGGGTVAFNNVSGFTGRLSTGCGRTVIDSLAFVKDPADLVLGPGTLRYTGSGETIPGLTVNSGSARGSVLAIDNDLTMLSCSLGTGLFIKSGSGTLTFAGTGTFRLGNTGSNYNINDLTGYPANGDSATSGIQSALIAEGKVLIGAVGDDANAPVIVANGDFWTGTHTTATGIETTGELVMNNGLVTVGSTFGAGYYNGDTNTAPQGLAPKVTINGGTINSASLMLGWDYRGIQTCRPELTLNGGTVNVAGTFGLGANAGVNATNTFIMNGGTLNAQYISCGLNKSGSMTNSPAYIYLNGGVVNLTYDLQLARYSSESYLYLNEGATLCARNINSGGGTSEAHFNGGVFRPAGSLSGITRAYIGEKGFILDTSAYPTNAFNASNMGWCELTQSLATDPALNGAPDGGLIKRGTTGFCMRPTYAFTFNGPVRVEEGMFGLQGAAVCDKEVHMLPGTDLRASNQDQWIGDLVLGAEGAEAPVLLDLVNATAGNGYVASNTLSVLSPVQIGMHPGGNTAGCMSMANGPHTTLVYRASSDANVDLSKFSIADGFPTKAGAVAKVDITSGAYAGWKAIVMTVSDNPNPSSKAWVSTSAGGAWSTGANWDGGTVPESKRDALVAFNPAAAANVPVNVDTPVKLGSFTLTAADAASGYAFSGQPMTLENTDNVNPATITVNSGDHTLGATINDPWVANTSGDADSVAVVTASGATARVTGAVSCLGVLHVNKTGSGGGTTILSGANTYNEGLNVRSGTAVIEAWNEAGVAGPLGLAANPTIGPGTFHYRGPDAVTARGLTLNAGSNSRTCIIRTDRDLTVSGVFNSTAGGFVKTGPGTLRLANTGTNKLCTAGDSANWNLIKNWPNNGDSPVPSTQTGFGAAVVDEGELVIGAPGQVMNYATAGSCDFFVGAQTRGWAYTTNAATLTVLDGLFNCNKWLYIGHCFVRDYDAATGSYAPTYATYNQYGGTVNLETFAMAYDLGPYNHSCQSVANLYGGQMNISSVFRFGQTYNKTGINPPHATINLYGGVINHYNKASKPYGTHMGYYSSAAEGNNAQKRACDATLNMYGGEFCDVQRIYMGGNASTSRLNLHGGKVVCENIFLQNTATGTDYDFFAGGKAYIFWNGGEYWPLGSNSANRTFGDLTQVMISTNGAVIDTSYLAADAVYTVSQILEHDAALDSADGGFTKRGAGTLALSGANTFNGWTTVEGGALRVRNAAALSSNVNVKAGAALDMDGTVYDVVNLSGTGASTNGTTRVTGVFTIGETNSAAGASFTFADVTFASGSTVKCDTTSDGSANDAFVVNGTLRSEGVVNLDFGRTEENPLSKPFLIKLADFEACEGIRFRAVNIGLPGYRIKTLIENSAVYVTLAQNGTAVLVR
ncbi:MAG TPA: autotransporter-associated beta strand repeat-containing protein [Kiritimatiellia bacterium]|nr:autotransporter-associated beta strand repeat-containing protein [Kiritimatiellia bacterium]